MKAIFNHVDELLPVHPIAKIWAENPLPMEPVPYHAGAIKNYKEKKIWVEALENKQKQLLVELGGER